MKISKPKLEQFINGTLEDSYKYFGSHLKKEGVFFRVWAGGAKEVSVIGDFNHWNPGQTPLTYIRDGIWEGLIEGVNEGDLYKYAVKGIDNTIVNKSDPFAFYSEKRPNSASVIFDIKKIKEGKKKSKSNLLHEPLNIYEMHLGSWKRSEVGEFLNYRDIAKLLASHLISHGYNAVEIMPVMEHPLDASWGYQTIGFYSVTSRYGDPHDFKYLIDYLHKKEIAVILDWSPGHFCQDEHGLREFDGTKLYESVLHPEWGTLNFDFKKGQVCSFLLSNALYWLSVFEVDGLRVDAVSSMLFLDYGIKQGYWVPNKYGGNENLEAIDFLKQLNKSVFAKHPYALMIAEESTSWPLVTYPVHDGGLGFNYKWNMGWMNDILKYIEMKPYFRGFNHSLISFSMMYAFSENYILPFSHDEVVHGKKSMIDKMPGNYEEKFANLRALMAYKTCHPGKKLSFMGLEVAQFIEWDEDREIDWFLLDFPMHKKFNTYLKKLNKLYLKEPALWEKDTGWEGFSWVDSDNHAQKVISFTRQSKEQVILAVINFSEFTYENFMLGVPEEGVYSNIMNSDLEAYGGSGFTVKKTVKTKPIETHHQQQSLELTIPAFTGLFYKLRA